MEGTREMEVVLVCNATLHNCSLRLEGEALEEERQSHKDQGDISNSRRATPLPRL